MKIKLFLTIGMLSIITLINSQTINTVSNGNWTDPLTWDCSCVPGNSDTLVIDHALVLNTNLVLSNTIITINASGSVTQDGALNRNIQLTGVYFTNSGLLDVNNFSVYQPAASSNFGTLTAKRFSTKHNFYNYGSLHADSLFVDAYGAGLITNLMTGLITGNRLTVNQSLSNYGKIYLNSIRNNGTITNQSGIIKCDSLTNNYIVGNFDSVVVNGKFWNMHTFYNGSAGFYSKLLVYDFFNYNAFGTPYFANSGKVRVSNNFYNNGNFAGDSSSSVVINNSSNNGGLIGGGDFCDLTPPSGVPYLDINTGTVDPSVTWCTPVAVGMNKVIKENTLLVFPNPSNSDIIIKGSCSATVKVIDLFGKTKGSYELNKQNGFTIYVADLESGIYYVVSSELNSNRKLVITR